MLMIEVSVPTTPTLTSASLRGLAESVFAAGQNLKFEVSLDRQSRGPEFATDSPAEAGHHCG
jgi:hypothetical protein